MNNQTIVHTTHGVKAFLDSNAFTLSAHRIQGLQQLLNKPHIHFTSAGANMAAQMDTIQDHDCIAETNKEMQLHPTLQQEPIEDAQMTLFCDGHSHHSPTGTLVTSYAVVEETPTGLQTVQSHIIPQPASAQMAELVAITEACKLAKNKTVTIYTDSAYAVQAVHVDLCHWRRKGFVTSAGTPVKHLNQLLDLYYALLEPERVAVVKCRGHQKGDGKIVRGNNAADVAAKTIAGYNVTKQLSQMTVIDKPHRDLCVQNIKELQDAASPTEKQAWKEKGATKDSEGLWRNHEGKIVAPAGLLNLLCQEAHSRAHGAASKVNALISQHWWHPYLKDITRYFVKS